MKKSIKIKSFIGAVVIASTLSGCMAGLNSRQKKEYAAFEQNNVLIEEKSPSTGALLGILPGFGSFYVGEIGFGIVNLVLWPYSILWDPLNGYHGAKVINYDSTKQSLKREKQKEISILTEQLALNQIDNKMYLLKKGAVEQKYAY